MSFKSSCGKSKNFPFKLSCGLMPSYYGEGSVQVDSCLSKLHAYTVEVTDLSMYESPVTDLDEKLPQSLRFNHHFLVVKVSKLLRPDGQPARGPGLLQIRAEKVIGEERTETGIIVMQENDIEGEHVQERFSASGLRVSILMVELLTILTEHPADYSLTGDNCWNYAHDTVVTLLRAFKRLQPEDRDRFQEHLQMVPAVVMPSKVAILFSIATTVGAGIGESVVITVAWLGTVVGEFLVTQVVPVKIFGPIVGGLLGYLVSLGRKPYPWFSPKLVACHRKCVYAISASISAMKDYTSPDLLLKAFSFCVHAISAGISAMKDYSRDLLLKAFSFCVHAISAGISAMKDYIRDLLLKAFSSWRSHRSAGRESSRRRSQAMTLNNSLINNSLRGIVSVQN